MYMKDARRSAQIKLLGCVHRNALWITSYGIHVWHQFHFFCDVLSDDQKNSQQRNRESSDIENSTIFWIITGNMKSNKKRCMD
ncbi:Uncharacterized protein ACO02O_03170 [Dirofilaria immitis]